MALSVDNAIRAGYPWDVVWDMSYMQLECIAAMSERKTKRDLRIDAVAARIGVNADKKTWEKFTKEEGG